MSSTKLGEEHLEAARKMVTKSKFSFFSSKPDYEGGAGEFEKAAKCFKEDPERVIYCHVQAADYWHLAGSSFQAAKQMQQAATVSSRSGANGRKAADLLLKASEYYVLSQNDDAAAETIGKAAQSVSESDPIHSLVLYRQCIEMWLQDGRNCTAIDPIKQAIALAIKNDLNEDTIEFMEMLVSSYSASKNIHGLSKASLSLIIYHLKTEEIERANREFEKGLLARDEHIVANALLESYNEQDIEKLEKAINIQAINFLDQPIIKIARKLAIHVVSKPATFAAIIPGFQPAFKVVASDGVTLVGSFRSGEENTISSENEDLC